MALSLSSALVSTSLSTNPSPNRNPNFSVSLSHFTITLSQQTPSHAQRSLSVSAISNSPGIESASSTVVSDDKTTADMLDKVEVFDLKGNAIPISDLWKDRKAVVAFARHFGCVFCRKRADYLASYKDRMDASGVALALIGPGSVDQARAFSEQTKFKGEVYADPSHSSYDALRFVSGVGTTFTPAAGLKIIQLYMEGYRQDWGLSFQKDTVTRGGWQQGGIIVAGPGKTNISYIHRVSPIRKKWNMNWGRSENRTRDLSHPKRESYH
ncbi:Peroxiredoxin-like 2A/B/C [Dillenia turbinata]|uniref:Peroxiredoxin-like 2A/B/C n=1 Tax=Dillenia turbinata TaxID=194707 RepID=A0AAN8W419_9MAGN